MKIDSPQNPTLKTVAKLLESRRSRMQEGRFAIEGAREIARAVGANVALERLYFCPALLSNEGREVLEQLREKSLEGVEWVELSERAAEKISRRENPDGLVAVAPLFERHLKDLQLGPDALLLVLENLEKPGNIGALLRTADGVGVDAVLVLGQTDLYNPNTIRSSQGSLFTQTVIACQSQELLEFFAANQVHILAATPHASQNYWQAQWQGRIAIALGTEHDGLSDSWMNSATQQVRIPMQGQADSLNVATAGALLLYEALRQRQR
jgi:RNA methyltransferase, TrmH family